MTNIMKICIVLMSILFFCCIVYAHVDHHVHEDEELLVQKGKEKWFKPPPAENPTDNDESADGVQFHHHEHDAHHHHKHDAHHHHKHDAHHRHEHDAHHHDHESHHHHGDEHHSHHHDSHEHSQSHGHQHVHHQADRTPTKVSKKERTFSETVVVWSQAICATMLISAVPFVLLFFIPLESNAAAYQPLLKLLLSFASGGLLGDAFLHLIPHAIHPHTHNENEDVSGAHHHDHDHHHGHEHHSHSETTYVGLWVLAGIVTFLSVEKFVRHVKGGHSHHHGHQHSEKHSEKENISGDSSKDGTEAKKGDHADSLRKRSKQKENSTGQKNNAEQDDHDKNSDEEEGMKVAGYLNLAADFTHNFTDGLAIGASFLAGRTLGMITTFTILLHEVPHEIGDFAILVQSGCEKRKAMFLQLSTATGALAGCVLGLLAENIGEAAVSWILPYTAGGFIYIATVSVLPELLEGSNPVQTVKEIIAMLLGIGMMVFITVLE